MRYLITGGTGFFANEYIKHFLATRVGTSSLCVFSRSESKQAERRAQYRDSEHLRWFIGDVRDQDRLRRAMDRVDIVIHAAALKRIEVAEYNVLEAVATNVLGTENVVKAAIDAGVRRVILLSSDKACDPTTTYGLTKAMAERIFYNAHHMAEHCLRRPWKPTEFVVCRYGNVMGSTGSVIPTWLALKRSGHKVVPISHPNVTRYWMTAADAVQIVRTAETLSVGKGEGPVIPHGLPAFRLEDLASAMRLDIRPTGLAKHEKLHERMSETGPDSSEVLRLEVEDIRERAEKAGLW